MTSWKCTDVRAEARQWKCVRPMSILVPTLQQARSAFWDIFEEHLSPAVDDEPVQWRLLPILRDGDAGFIYASFPSLVSASIELGQLELRLLGAFALASLPGSQLRKLRPTGRSFPLSKHSFDLHLNRVAIDVFQQQPVHTLSAFPSFSLNATSSQRAGTLTILPTLPPHIDTPLESPAHRGHSTTSFQPRPILSSSSDGLVFRN